LKCFDLLYASSMIAVKFGHQRFEFQVVS
jgi:hypothetical protein